MKADIDNMETIGRTLTKVVVHPAYKENTTSDVLQSLHVQTKTVLKQWI
jgi:hypothetical protein